MVNSSKFKDLVSYNFPSMSVIYTSSTTWTAPKDGIVLAFGCGGGGGAGGASTWDYSRSHNWGGGGYAGNCRLTMFYVAKDDKLNITVGSGGSGGNGGTDAAPTSGSIGGTTTITRQSDSTKVFTATGGGGGSGNGIQGSANGAYDVVPPSNCNMFGISTYVADGSLYRYTYGSGGFGRHSNNGGSGYNGVILLSYFS